MRCSTYGGELGTRTQTRRARPVGNPVNMTMRDIQRLQYSLLFVTTAVTPRPAAAPRVLTTRYDRLHPEASSHLDGERTTDPPFKVYLASIPLPLPSTGLLLVSRTATGIYSSVRSVSRDRRRPGRTRGGGPGNEYHGSNVLNASTDRARPGGSHVQHRFLRAWTQGEQRNGRGMDTRSRHPPAGGRHGVSLRGLRRRTVRRPSESAYNYPLYK